MSALFSAIAALLFLVFSGKPLTQGSKETLQHQKNLTLYRCNHVCDYIDTRLKSRSHILYTGGIDPGIHVLIFANLYEIVPFWPLS